jgi:NAD(P)-dependent dehydrogenase (short-subunit alcohol dehydrogenase family)
MPVSQDLFSLSGKVAIVTGAGGRPGGIGEAYASALAAFGAAVVVADVNQEGALEAAERLRGEGARAVGVAVDITDPASVRAMTERAVVEFGGVDILVNNAALMVEILRAATSTISLEDWNRILSVNLTGALLCSQACAPLMRERGGGRIINQSSAGAYPALSVYGITKLALVGLTTALAQELGRSNITVNAIAPGIVNSGAGQSMRAAPSRWSQIVAETCALRAHGAPEELVGALLFLCSEAGAWTTGQVLHVDGGVVLRP